MANGTPKPVTEDKLEACRTEVQDAISELHRRVESAEVIQQIIHEIYKSTKHTDERLSNLMISFSSYEAKQEALNNGFPNDDPEGHRRAHELFIEQARKKAEFWGKLRDEIAKWGILGVIGFLLTSIYFYVKAEMHK